MLVDHHCHLDFPDFADDLDGVVGRAEAAGVGLHGDDLDAHAAASTACGRSPSATTTCSARSARIRTMRTRSSTSRSRRSCGWRGTPRWWRSARRGSTTSTTTVRARRRPRASATTSPRRGRRSCRSSSMRAMPTRTRPPSWRRRRRKGAFPAVLHCYTGGADLAPGAGWRSASTCRSPASSPSRSRTRCARSRADVPLDRLLVETDAPYLAPGKYRGKRNEPAYVAITAAELAKVKGVSQAELARATTDNFFRLYSKTPRSGGGRMSMRFTILGCGSSGGVPRVGNVLGRLRSDQPEEPAAALRAAGRAVRQGRTHGGAGRHAARHPRAAARCTRRDAGRRAVHARPCRPHARHRRSARHLLHACGGASTSTSTRRRARA